MSYGVKEDPVVRLERRLKRAPSGCLEWQGPNKRGYGRIGVYGKLKYAHRLAWELEHGPLLPEQFVCHTCDNPKCCELSHLYVGTPKDNARDMVARDRQARGEGASQVKLTEKQVLEIRRRSENGESRRKIAPDYGVSDRHISMVVSKHSWRHI